MNLKENYERFFGKIKVAEPKEQVTLTDSQKARFNTLATGLGKKYPNVPLTIRENFVWAGNKKLEPVQDFLKKSSLAIQEQVRVLSGKSRI